MQAQKEGNTEVYDQMKAVFAAALEVKQVCEQELPMLELAS